MPFKRGSMCQGPPVCAQCVKLLELARANFERAAQCASEGNRYGVHVCLTGAQKDLAEVAGRHHMVVDREYIRRHGIDPAKHPDFVLEQLKAEKQRMDAEVTG